MHNSQNANTWPSNDPFSDPECSVASSQDSAMSHQVRMRSKVHNSIKPKSFCARSKNGSISEMDLPEEAVSEIESLKVVLELRLEELSHLRRENMELQVQNSHLKEIKSQLRNEERRVEELDMILKSKVNVEHKALLEVEDLKQANISLVKELKDKGLALESFQYKYLQAESRVADMMDFINSNGLSYDPEGMTTVQAQNPRSPVPSKVPQRPNTAHGCRGRSQTTSLSSADPDDRPISPVRPFPLDQFGGLLSPPTPRNNKRKSPLADESLSPSMQISREDVFPVQEESHESALF
ncbi:hypothetical protein Ciccas_010234 [Cichlidogyrus casuarinus]|uniref:Uncharacterized protein n=1 Tax=Cichlidogyrus casuarinus TaxID=1844966 RepID=A0ABD2PVS0_9PLAT